MILIWYADPPVVWSRSYALTQVCVRQHVPTRQEITVARRAARRAERERLMAEKRARKQAKRARKLKAVVDSPAV